MTLPVKTVRIGPHDYKIGRLTSDEAEANLGLCKSAEHAILMREKYASDRQEAEIILHEMTHAIYVAQGLRPKDGEERIVEAIGSGMVMAIRDNQILFKWILAKLR